MQILGIVASASGGNYWIGLINNLDTIRSIVCDSSNNIYTAGHAGNSAVLISQKTDSSIIWQKKITGTGSDSLWYNSVNLDSSNNVFGGGYNYNSPTLPALFTKYNSSGVIQLQRTITATSNAVITDTAVDSSGNIYVVGQENGSGGSVATCFIAKYNSSGTLQTQKYFESSGVIDSFSSINLDSSGNIYLTSSFYGFVVKLDSSLSLTWSKDANIFGGKSVIDSSANIYMCGYSGTEGGYVMKFNSSGTLVWQRKIADVASYDFITRDSDNNIYVGGRYFNSITGLYDGIVAKYDSSGAIQWQRKVAITSSNARIYGITIGNNNKLVFGIGADSSNNLIMAIPSDGSLTGTYTVGSLTVTYGATTFTDAAGTRTPSTLTLSTGNSTTTDATSSYTDSTSTTTVTKTTI